MKKTNKKILRLREMGAELNELGIQLDEIGPHGDKTELFKRVNVLYKELCDIIDEN